MTLPIQLRISHSVIDQEIGERKEGRKIKDEGFEGGEESSYP